MKIYIIIFLLTSISLFSEEKELIIRFDKYDWDNNSGVIALDKIICLDTNECYIAVEERYNTWEANANIYKSDDQGKTWRKILETESTKEKIKTLSITDFAVVDSNHIYLAMDNNRILKYTEDGGKTMNFLQFPKHNANNTVYKIVMIDTLKGIARMNHILYRTFDNWETYDSLVYYNRWYLNFQIKNDSIIRIITYNHNEEVDLDDLKYYSEYNINTNKVEDIYRFEKEYIENGETLWLEDLYFINDSLGFVCGKRDIGETGQAKWDLIYKTTDGGKSWKNVLKDMNGTPFGLHEIDFADEYYGVAVGSFGKLYESTDGGENWVFRETPEEFNDPTTRVEFAGQIALVGEMNGNVWTWGYPQDPDAIHTDYSDKIKFIQKHNELLISIKDETYKKYRLQIVDVMGRNMIDRSINSSALGNVFYPVDIKQLNAGSYYYSLSVGGEFVASGKFVRGE